MLLPTQYDSLHSLCLYIRLLGPIIGWISVNVALLGEPAAPPRPPPYRASPLSVPRPCLGGGLRVPSLLISLFLSFSFSAAGPEQLRGVAASQQRLPPGATSPLSFFSPCGHRAMRPVSSAEFPFSTATTWPIRLFETSPARTRSRRDGSPWTAWATLSSGWRRKTCDCPSGVAKSCPAILEPSSNEGEEHRRACVQVYKMLMLNPRSKPCQDDSKPAPPKPFRELRWPSLLEKETPANHL